MVTIQHTKKIKVQKIIVIKTVSKFLSLNFASVKSMVVLSLKKNSTAILEKCTASTHH